jgi:hypothetical protein
MAEGNSLTSVTKLKIIMELDKYQTIIAQTAVFPKSVDNFDLAYGYMGLMDEWIEWIDELQKYEVTLDKHSVVKEHGDWIWYTTALCVFLDIPLKDVFSPISSFSSVLKNKELGEINRRLLKFNGNVKKYYRDKKELDTRELLNIIRSMSSYGEHIAKEIGYSIPEVLQVNYDKLIKRRETNTIHGDGDHRESELQS